jgi:D-glycerate 3-kinase
MSDAPLWPSTRFALCATDQAKLLQRLAPTFAHQLSRNQLPAAMSSELARLYLPLANWLNRRRPAAGPLLIGINGSQGSGKSTLCNLLKAILESAFDCRTCVISIDDLYLPQSVRRQLAKEIHPLLETRGVPGTHDIPLGLELFAGLKNDSTDKIIAIPRFNKATDDRLPAEQWQQVGGAVDLVLFEGWCVGATPQAEGKLAAPLNFLEEQEDPDGRWRSYVNQQLAGPYRQLFAQLDLLLMLKIPEWEMVYHWRKRQEEQLAARRSGCGVMGDTALRRFIQHYERLTRHQLAVLPEKADLVMELNREQRVTAIKLR